MNSQVVSLRPEHVRVREEPLARTTSLSSGVTSRQRAPQQKHSQAARQKMKGVKEMTAGGGQRLNQQCESDLLPSSVIEHGLSSADEWEDKDAVLLMDVFE